MTVKFKRYSPLSLTTVPLEKKTNSDIMKNNANRDRFH